MSDNTSSHTHRILTVAEAVALRGPVTLNELVDDLPFSRGAVWRCLDTLRAKGWIRMRNGDGAFELTFHTKKTYEKAHFSAPHMPLIGEIVSKIKCLGPFHVEYGEFVEEGVFVICETTRRDGYTNKRLSLTDDDIAMAGQVSLGKTELLIHLRVFLERASMDEIQHIQSGNHNTDLRRHRLGGVVWGADKTSCSLPCKAVAADGSAVRIELKKETIKSKEQLKSTVDLILKTGFEAIIGLDDAR